MAYCGLFSVAVGYNIGRKSRESAWLASFTVKKESFALVYAPVVHKHLAAIDAKYDSLIREKTDRKSVVRERVYGSV